MVIDSYQKQCQILPVLIPDAYQSKEDEKIALETLFQVQENRDKQVNCRPSSSHPQPIWRCPLHSLRSLESIQTLISLKTIKNPANTISVCSSFSKIDFQ